MAEKKERVTKVGLPKMIGLPDWSVEETVGGSVVKGGSEVNVVIQLNVAEAQRRVDEMPPTKKVVFTMDPGTLEVALNGMNKIKDQLQAP
ncbi:hypothetical protein DIPPA_33748 [Diplonema papillatum]|nr:hypothetical protein DIPPA_33748 [Diplonema papillatum]